MAAARRRKAEERGVRRLRELTALPHNRACGDCGQRGPTYADMTVGSFVCTACSGLLRGLNPPHRVKSISMTTFSQQEIDFLQNHGNEVCRATWMGLHSERVGSLPDHKDSQKTKEFLQDKYEKKRWFIPAEQAFAAAEGAAGWTSAESGGGAPPSIAQGNTVTQPAVSIRPPRPGGANVAAVVAPAAASTVTGAATGAATSAVDLLGDLGVGVDAGPAANPRLGTAARGGQQAEFTAFSSAA
ncbi:arf-GAP domain and FG repeat-containing protein 1-like, partial [Lampetra planeri]